mgnify:CR=1 FL=1|jgi:hypothetical protein
MKHINKPNNKLFYSIKKILSNKNNKNKKLTDKPNKKLKNGHNNKKNLIK